jgi:rhodanese-related sulfurtransferase
MSTEDSQLQIPCRQVAEKLGRGESFRFVDLRGSDFGVVPIDGAEMATEDLMESLLTLPEDAEIVFYCHHGIASLEVAEFFRERGFRRARSMIGGVAAWAREVDPGLPSV